jgi:hypothetical protein
VRNVCNWRFRPDKPRRAKFSEFFLLRAFAPPDKLAFRSWTSNLTFGISEYHSVLEQHLFAACR